MIGITKEPTRYLYCAECHTRINDDYAITISGVPADNSRNGKVVSCQMHRTCAANLARDFDREMNGPTIRMTDIRSAR